MTKNLNLSLIFLCFTPLFGRVAPHRDVNVSGVHVHLRGVELDKSQLEPVITDFISTVQANRAALPLVEQLSNEELQEELCPPAIAFLGLSLSIHEAKMVFREHLNGATSARRPFLDIARLEIWDRTQFVRELNHRQIPFYSYDAPADRITYSPPPKRPEGGLRLIVIMKDDNADQIKDQLNARAAYEASVLDAEDKMLAFAKLRGALMDMYLSEFAARPEPRWFSTGLSGYLAYRLIAELDNPEAITTAYRLLLAELPDVEVNELLSWRWDVDRAGASDQGRALALEADRVVFALAARIGPQKLTQLAEALIVSPQSGAPVALEPEAAKLGVDLNVLFQDLSHGRD